MIVVMDSSTVILLAKTSTLETSLKEHNIQITKEVYAEVMEGKNKMLPDALLLERLHQENKINLVSANEQLTKKIAGDFNLENGEASTIAVAIKDKKAVASDDRQARKAAKIQNLQLTGAIGIIINLFKKGKITINKATQALKTLEEQGRFEKYLIEKANEDLK